MSACIPRIPPKHLISQMGDALEERDVTIAKLQAVVDAVCWSRTPKKQAAVYRYRATLEEGTGVCYSEGIADALEKLAEEDK